MGDLPWFFVCLPGRRCFPLIPIAAVSRQALHRTEDQADGIRRRLTAQQPAGSKNALENATSQVS